LIKSQYERYMWTVVSKKVRVQNSLPRGFLKAIFFMIIVDLNKHLVIKTFNRFQSFYLSFSSQSFLLILFS
jgi:hypothetical protein